MKFTSRILIVLLGALAAAPRVYAADSGGYLGFSYGFTQARDFDELVDITADIAADAGFTILGTSEDDSDKGLKIFGGYRINKNVALEAAWIDLGDYTGSIAAELLSFPVTLKLKGEVDGLAFAVIGRLPVNDRVSVFGKLGMFDWDTDFTLEAVGIYSESFDDGGTDPIYGIGLSYDVWDRVAIRVEWERFTDLGDEIDVDMLSLGISQRF